jgi:hypothetical protein
MNNQNLAISILEDKTKIVVFQITQNKDIIIDEVHIINKFISKDKVQKVIKKVLKTFIINQTIISIYNNCSKPSLISLEDIFLILDLKNYEILNELFVINEAIKCIDKDKLKNIETKLKYIKNGWLDFSQLKDIDLNGLIHYALNNWKI